MEHLTQGSLYGERHQGAWSTQSGTGGQTVCHSLTYFSLIKRNNDDNICDDDDDDDDNNDVYDDDDDIEKKYIYPSKNNK